MADALEEMFLESGKKKGQGKLLAAFCRKENDFADVQCFATILTFSGRKSWLVSSLQGTPHQQAVMIYATFLAPNTAPQEVNCSGNERKKIKDILFPTELPPSLKGPTGRRGAVHVSVSRSLFENVQRTLTTNLSDTYGRFVKTKEFADYTAYVKKFKREPV